MDKENSATSIDMSRSPPLFARLREISNNLKLIDSTPTCIKLPQQRNLPCEGPVYAEPGDFEPKTPSFKPGKENERLYLNTPQEVSKTCYRVSKVNSFFPGNSHFVCSPGLILLTGFILSCRTPLFKSIFVL